jgi:CHAD domain-containing protein
MATVRYEVGERFQLEPLGAEQLETRSFTSVYYDTPDRRLAAAGLTLHRRLERGTNVWQVQAPDGEPSVDIEGTSGPGGPPDAVQELLRLQQGGRRLVELATLRVRQSSFVIDDAAVTLHEVQVMEGQHVRDRFAELSAVPAVAEADLARVDELLVRAGARRRPRSAGMWGVLGRPKRRRPSRKASALTHLQARFRELGDELLAADIGLRVRDDPEDVHRMRVATRRLRATLRASRKVFDRDWNESLRRELDFLGDALGAVRDLDVLISHLDQAAGELDHGDAIAVAPLLQVLRERRKAARESLSAALAGDRYLALTRTVEQAASSPPVSDPDLRLEALARKEFKRLRKAFRGLRCDPGDLELHKLRIRAKRARYAAELAEPVRGGRAKKFATKAKRVQDVLGEHQDAVVAEKEIRDLAGRLPRHAASLAAGRLVATERIRRQSALERLPSARRRVVKSGKAAWV